MKREDITVQIGQNIKFHRKKKKKTQLEVAVAVGVSRSVYARYESGVIEIPVTTFALICSFLDISPDAVLKGVTL